MIMVISDFPCQIHGMCKKKSFLGCKKATKNVKEWKGNSQNNAEQRQIVTHTKKKKWLIYPFKANFQKNKSFICLEVTVERSWKENNLQLLMTAFGSFKISFPLKSLTLKVIIYCLYHLIS